MNARQRWTAYLPQVFIAVDQLANALIPPFFTLSWADETLSARTWRAASKGRVVGRLALPFIDWLFAWQTPDVLDEHGQPIRSHCHRAYLKEQAKRGLPPEYRDT